MLMQRNKLNFSGQNIYVGIDVHLMSWSITILTEHLHHKTFTQPSSISVLVHYLTHNFPGGVYRLMLFQQQIIFQLQTCPILSISTIYISS